jgi:DNA polymerase I-like protein with 3'-5' exonuclease and polymerase domains/5'-3' exonuclease
MKRLIVDMSSVIKRCLYAGIDGENGKKVEFNGKLVQVNSGVYGYDNAINSIVACLTDLQMTPADMILVVESGNSKVRRRQIYTDYKATREEKPQEVNDAYREALDLVVTAMRNLGATVVTQPHIEADDVIAYLARNLSGSKVIFSEDGDLATLIGGDTMMYRQGKLLHENPYGPFETRHIPLMKCLVGDGDEYKGAVGFGPKMWLDLLVNYGDYLDALETLVRERRLSELEDDAKDFKPFRKVIDGAEHVYQSYQCALLHDEWVNTLRQPLQWKAGMVKPAQDYRLRQWGQQVRLVTADNYADAYRFFEAKMKETREVCLDLETTVPEEGEEWLRQRTDKGWGVDVFGSTIVSCGLSFGSNGQYGFYVSVDHKGTNNVSPEQLQALLELIPQTTPTIAHNASGFELPVLFNAFGKAWQNNGWRGFLPNMVDSQIAASYWDENQPSLGLKALSLKLLDYEQETYAQVTTIDGVQYKMDQLSAEHVLSYGLDDCFTAQGLYNFFRAVMDIEDTFDAFMRIEQKPMYLSAWSFVQGTPISLQRLLELKKADEEATVGLQQTLDQYLISKGWEGSVCPVFDELTPSNIKIAVSVLLDKELKTAVCTVSKLAKLVEGLEHEDAPLLAQLIETENLDSINDWVRRRFVARPEFNIGSFVQIGKLMYEVMGLPIRLRNKATEAMRAKGIREGNPQTDDDAINMAIKMGDAKGEEAEALTALLELKSIRTRTSLYWEPYPKFLHWRDNLLHPEIRQCSTNTRRHTGANPNLQQQDSTPGGVRTVVQPHHKEAVFVSLDLAGQEIRLLGDYSRDENIMSAYIGDPPKDLHSFTAAMILGVSYDEFRARYKSEDPEVAAEANKARQSAKVVFFASSYGAMAPKIALGLGISEELAQSYLDALDKAFPRVTPWKMETEELAKRDGWVPVMGGTRRHLREVLLSDDRYTASKALRQASNARIQGAGGNQIRTIMGRVWGSDLFERYDVRFYWPVHDELCFSVHRDHAVPVIQALHGFMCEKFLDVLPSSSSIGIGPNYGDLIEIGEVADPALIQEAVAKIFNEEVAATA